GVDVGARLLAERAEVPDDLEALDRLPELGQVDALEEEVAALHPLVRHGALGTATDGPPTDEAIEGPQRRRRLGRRRQLEGGVLGSAVLVRAGARLVAQLGAHRPALLEWWHLPRVPGAATTK